LLPGRVLSVKTNPSGEDIYEIKVLDDDDFDDEPDEIIDNIGLDHIFKKNDDDYYDEFEDMRQLAAANMLRHAVTLCFSHY